MRRPTTRQRRLVILLLALLTFGIAYYGGNRYSTPPPVQISGMLLTPAVPLPAFQLQDQHGEIFGNAQLEGRWSLLLLGPASDPQDSALRRLVQIHNRLADDPILQRRTFFVYLVEHPGDRLSDRFSELGKNFILPSGEAAQFDDLFRQLGNSQSSEDNLALYVVDPDTNIQAVYTGDLDAAGIARDIHSLIARRR